MKAAFFFSTYSSVVQANLVLNCKVITINPELIKGKAS